MLCSTIEVFSSKQSNVQVNLILTFKCILVLTVKALQVGSFCRYWRALYFWSLGLSLYFELFCFTVFRFTSSLFRYLQNQPKSAFLFCTFQVVSSSLLCVAEVVCGLKAHAIPFLPQLVPPVIKLIKRNQKDRYSAIFVSYMRFDFIQCVL